ncbi:ras GEF [Serendipita vermifera]|nr:ras GEF [Serendipita vermifera]
MATSDDELDHEVRRPRASLDAQRYSIAHKTATISPPVNTSAAVATFLLPILIPTATGAQNNVRTQPISLKEISGQKDIRSSQSSAAALPQEIVNADLAIAVDRTFIETSSGLAARELKKFYERMGAESLIKGTRLRTPYVITSLTIDGEQRYRVSPRHDGDLLNDNATSSSGRPSSIIPSLINAVIMGNTRNSHSSTARQTLRRPRSISEPRESNHYAEGSFNEMAGGFVNPFATTSRRSFDHRRASMDDAPEPFNQEFAPKQPPSAPFGPGISYNDPSKPLSPKIKDLLNPQLREVQSFDSNVTAKLDETSHSKQNTPIFRSVDKETTLSTASTATTPYSTIVFDVLQTYRGAPLPDRLSEASSEPTVKLSSTTSALPKDDPRFVIWGEFYSDHHDEYGNPQGSYSDLSINRNTGIPSYGRRSQALTGDISSVYYPTQKEKAIVAATIERWIAQLTSENESFELLCFFLTYRTYISGVDLCHLLICRFHWALEKTASSQDRAARALVRVRTYKMIQYWLMMWFKVDFATNPALCQVLTHWVNTLRKDPALSKLHDALDLVRRIKRLIRDCKQETERSKANSKTKEPITPSSYQRQHEGSDSDVDLNLTRHNGSIFNDAFASSGLVQVPILSAGPRPSSISQAPNSLDYSSEMMVPSSVETKAGSPSSATQTVLTQPLPMAILAQSKPVTPSTHSLNVVNPSALPIQHGAISRAFVNAIGKLGRWRRVLNARNSPGPTQLDCSGVAPFDIDQNYDGVRASHYGYFDDSRLSPQERPAASNTSLQSINTPYEDVIGVKLAQPASPLATLEEGPESDADGRTPQPSLLPPSKKEMTMEHMSDLTDITTNNVSHHDAAVSTEITHSEETPFDPPVEVTMSATNHSVADPAIEVAEDKVSQTPHYQSSKGEYPTQEVERGRISDYVPPTSRHSAISSEGNRNSFFDSSEEDYGEPLGGTTGWGSIRSFKGGEFIEIDQYLSSDEGDYGGEGRQFRKVAKRLPHQRDLQIVSRVDSRSSRDALSTSGYSSYSSQEEDGQSQTSSIQVRDAKQNKVYAWQLDYIVESEEDEPRDVEAALRRLEGHIDRDRQRKKENKIDGWLQQVRERKAQEELGIKVADVASSNASTHSADHSGRPESGDLSAQEHQITPGTSNQTEGLTENPPYIDTNQETEETIGISAALDQVEDPSSLLTQGLTKEPLKDAPIAPEHPYQSREHPASFSNKPSFVKISGSRIATPQFKASTVHYESFILLHRSLKVAQHLTMIESDLWRSVPFEDLVAPSLAVEYDVTTEVREWGEIMKQRAKLRTGHTNRSVNDLLIVKARFQLTVMFTASEILLTRQNLRPVLISKLIRIALKCYTLNNFSTLVAIITGLSLPPVQAAMDSLPKGIGLYEMRIYQSLKSFCSPEGNYRMIREAITGLITSHKSNNRPDPSTPSSSSTVASADISTACIPFIGIYLSQLYKYDKLPDYVDPTSPTEPVGIGDEQNGTLTQPRHPEVFDNLAPLPSSMTLEPLINVHKQRLISQVVLSFLNSQQLTGKYKFGTERNLYQRCLRLRALDMVTLRRLSQSE